MRRLTMAEEVLWSDLKQRSLYERPDDRLFESGSLIRRTFDGRERLVRVRHEERLDLKGSPRRVVDRIGPIDHPAGVARTTISMLKARRTPPSPARAPSRLGPGTG